MNKQLVRLTCLVCLMLASTGCKLMSERTQRLENQVPPDCGMPRELAKTVLPAYQVEPPDVLLVDAVKVIPKAPHHIEPLDLLQIIVSGTLEGEPPVQGEYRVESSGVVILGPAYGSVKVVGLTLAEATQAIQVHLEQILSNPAVSVSLAEPAAKQQIAGEHLVGPDGMVNLGIYGSVHVAGLTVAETRAAIERHLSQYLEAPEVSVDVAAYNSKVYYIVTQGAGQGDQITSATITGNETVLDAVSQIGGFTQLSSKRMWIARPSPDEIGVDQVLPVNWDAIAQGGSAATNYQILPGDRLFVAEDSYVAFDSWVNKMTAPFERIIGFTLLGTQTVQTINRSPSGYPRGTNLGTAALLGLGS